MFFVLFSFISLAQSAEIITLAPIEVSGVKPSLDSRSSIVITSDEIQKSKTRTIPEILRRAAGVDLISSNQSGNASASIRGGSGGQTLVIIDGVKANDPSESTRSFDWSTLDPNQIDRIEILKGPQAIAFGSDALAGAIIIKTKASKKSFRTQVVANTEAGSRETLRNSLLIKHPFDSQYSIQAQLKQRSTKGPTGNAAKVGKGDLDGSDEYSGQVRAQAFLNTLEIVLGADRQYTHLDLDTASFSDDPNFVSRALESKYFFQTTAKISSDLKTDFLISRVTTRRSYDDPSTTDTTYRGARWDIENRYENRISSELKFLLGFEAKREELKIESRLFSSNLRNNKQDSLSLFTQALYSISEITDFDLGLRGDYYDTFGSALNFRTGLKTKISKALALNFGAASGFKAPSLYSLYDQQYGNQNLKAERSYTYETGLEYSPNGEFKTELQVFQTHSRDLFGYNPLTFQSLNFSKARTHGIEWQNQVQLSPELALKSHLTYLKAKDLTRNTELPNRSAFKGGLNLDNQWNDSHVSTAEWIAKSSTTAGAPGYGLIHLSHSFNLNSKCTSSLRLENILDKNYQEVRGYHSPRRSVFAGLEYKF